MKILNTTGALCESFPFAQKSLAAFLTRQVVSSLITDDDNDIFAQLPPRQDPNDEPIQLVTLP